MPPLCIPPVMDPSEIVEVEEPARGRIERENQLVRQWLDRVSAGMSLTEGADGGHSRVRFRE